MTDNTTDTITATEVEEAVAKPSGKKLQKFTLNTLLDISLEVTPNVDDSDWKTFELLLPNTKLLITAKKHPANGGWQIRDVVQQSI